VGEKESKKDKRKMKPLKTRERQSEVKKQKNNERRKEM
jgi:hypothetical protein